MFTASLILLNAQVRFSKHLQRRLDVTLFNSNSQLWPVEYYAFGSKFKNTFGHSKFGSIFGNSDNKFKGHQMPRFGLDATTRFLKQGCRTLVAQQSFSVAKHASLQELAASYCSCELRDHPVQSLHSLVSETAANCSFLSNLGRLERGI